MPRLAAAAGRPVNVRIHFWARPLTAPSIRTMTGRMSDLNRDPARFRPNVGLAMFSRAGHVFLGRRINARGPFQWQMPQGGIDRDEEPANAALRELEEEIGVPAKLVSILEETEDWIYYEFPPDVKRRLPGPFLGQRQKWFALRFNGSDSDVRLDRHTPEFDAWRWARLAETPGLIVPFKRPVYEIVAERFQRWTAPMENR